MRARETGKGTDYIGSPITIIREGQTYERAYAIERPYGILIYDAQEGMFSVELESLIEPMEAFEVEYTAGPGKITQIVKNSVIKGAPAKVIPNELLQNSLDAIDQGIAKGVTPKGKALIEVVVDTTLKGAPFISVKDNGKGMTPEELNKKLLEAGAEGGKGEYDRGQFGMANIGFLFYPEKVSIQTVAKVGKKKISSLLDTTGEALQSGEKQTAFKEEVASTIPTGTTIRLEFSADDKKVSEREFIKYFNKLAHSTFVPHIRYRMPELDNPSGDMMGNFPSIDRLKKTRPPLRIKKGVNEAVVHFVDNKELIDRDLLHSWQKKGWAAPLGGYFPHTLILNKGLPTGQDRTSLTPGIKGFGVGSMRDGPDFALVINFERTAEIKADVRGTQENYPWIDNRTEWNSEFREWLEAEIGPILTDLSDATFNQDIENFKKMSAQSPTFGREKIPVLLPFMGNKDMEAAKKIIEENKDLFSRFAEVAGHFRKLVRAKAGQTYGEALDIAITIEPGIWGFRSKPDMLGHEYVAVNPFQVHMELIESENGKGVVSDNNLDPASAAADASTHAFVHEYAHWFIDKKKEKAQSVEDHGKEFVYDLARIHGYMGHDDLSIIGDMLYGIFEADAGRVKSIAEDITNLGEGGSLIRDSLKTISSPETTKEGLKALRADEGRAKEKVTKPTPVPTKTTKEPSVDPGSTKLYSIGGALTEGVKTKLKGKPYETTPADDRMQWDPQDLKITDKAFWSAKVSQVYQALVDAQAPIRKLAKIAKAPLQAKRIEQMVRRLRGIQGALETILVDHGPFIIGPDGKPRFFVTSKPLGKILSDGLNPVAKRRGDRPEQTYRDYEKMRKSERFVAIYNATKESADTRATKIFPTHTADKQKAQDRSTRAGQAAYKRVQKNIEEAQNDIDRFQRFLALEADANDHIEESGYDV
ncbi:MAG: ATP-binding protein, partial [Candidatus Thorarchaeota archaeon]